MKLSKYNFRTRLIAGFGIVIVLNVISIIISLQKINDIRDGLTQMYNHPLAVSNALREINSNINGMHRTMKDVVLSENSDQLLDELELIYDYDKKIRESFEIVFNRFLGDMKDVDKAYAAYNTWESIRTEVITSMQLGRKKEAIQITRGKGAAHIKKLFYYNRIMIVFAKSKADELFLENKKEGEKAVIGLISIFILIFSLSLIIAIIISNSISLPIKSLISRIQHNYKINIKTPFENLPKTEQQMLEHTVILIEKAADELKLFNTELEKKVKERTIKLQENEELLNITEKISKVGGWQIDLGAQSLSWTEETFRIHELSNNLVPTIEEAINFYDKNSKGIISKAVDNAIGSGEPFDLDLGIITAKNNKKLVNALGQIRRNGNGKVTHVYGTFQDITERKNAEQAITQYGKIIENSLNEIFIFDADSFKFIQVNKGARTNMGYSLKELVKMTPWDINPAYTKKRFDELIKPLKDRTQERIVFKTEHQRKDKTIYPVEINLQKSVLKQNPVYIAFVADITKRLEDENALKETNKSLQEMVYIASHDLQVPLVSMEGYASELLENNIDKLDEEGVYCLKRLQSNAQRMHKLVLSLLDISRLTTIKNPFEEFSLYSTINKIVKDISLTVEKSNATIFLDKLPSLYADKQRIESVYRNLILNSLNYNGKNITIGFENNIFFVKDDGIGIPKQQLKKVFEPGERLKILKTEGVGMGLTFCKKVIEQHNGKIWAESEGENKGTNIYIELDKCRQ